MGNLKVVLGLAVLALVLSVGWQTASCELANVEFHADLKDIAAQGGAHIGLGSFHSDDELRDSVIRVAKKYDIQLDPAQIKVERAGTVPDQKVYLTADYDSPVKLLGLFSFNLHFHPSSAK